MGRFLYGMKKKQVWKDEPMERNLSTPYDPPMGSAGSCVILMVVFSYTTCNGCNLMPG